MVNIAFATSTRAEYGLLKSLILEISKNKNFNMMLLVTGTHLSKEYGMTINEIKRDNLEVFKEIKTLEKKNSARGVSKTMSNTIKKFSKAFEDNKIDLLILLGDRYEVLCIAIVANLYNIPIAHIHGGEVTQGSLDDRFRHSITKMSDFHFTSAKEHSKRVIQLGEDPNKVFNVGAIGIDNIKNYKLLSKKELKKIYNFNFEKPYFLVTIHPDSTDIANVDSDFNFLLKCINCFKNYNYIFTYTNADVGGKEINKNIDNLVLKNTKNIFVIPSLGSLNYLSTMKHAKALLGNSSSGIFEAPSLNVPTINIGRRQKGRPTASTVFNVEQNLSKFKNAVQIILKTDFKKIDNKNPYGDGTAKDKIYDIIKKLNLKIDKKKTFYDFN